MSGIDWAALQAANERAREEREAPKPPKPQVLPTTDEYYRANPASTLINNPAAFARVFLGGGTAQAAEKPPTVAVGAPPPPPTAPPPVKPPVAPPAAPPRAVGAAPPRKAIMTEEDQSRQEAQRELGEVNAGMAASQAPTIREDLRAAIRSSNGGVNQPIADAIANRVLTTIVNRGNEQSVASFAPPSADANYTKEGIVYGLNYPASAYATIMRDYQTAMNANAQAIALERERGTSLERQATVAGDYDVEQQRIASRGGIRQAELTSGATTESARIAHANDPMNNVVALEKSLSDREKAARETWGKDLNNMDKSFEESDQYKEIEEERKQLRILRKRAMAQTPGFTGTWDPDNLFK